MRFPSVLRTLQRRYGRVALSYFVKLLRHFARGFRCVVPCARGYPPSDAPTGDDSYSQDLLTGDVIAYTPGAGEAAGSPYTVTVSATDGLGNLTETDIEVQIAPNLAPTLQPIADQTVVAGQVVSFLISATDADGPGPLTLSQTNDLPGAEPTFTQDDAGSGSFSWTSGPADDGTYSITVSATDGLGNLSQRTVTVRVDPVP